MKRVATAVAQCGSASPATPSASPAAAIDRTAAVKAAAGGTFERLITKATEDEPGRLQVDTTLTSKQGTEATVLCVKVHEGWNYLVVTDINGSTLATFNHPRHPGVCFKV